MTILSRHTKRCSIGTCLVNAILHHSRRILTQACRFHPARLHARGSLIRMLPDTSIPRDRIVHRLHRVYMHTGHEREPHRMDSC